MGGKSASASWPLPSSADDDASENRYLSDVADPRFPRSSSLKSWSGEETDEFLAPAISPTLLSPLHKNNAADERDHFLAGWSSPSLGSSSLHGFNLSATYPPYATHGNHAPTQTHVASPPPGTQAPVVPPGPQPGSGISRRNSITRFGRPVLRTSRSLRSMNPEYKAKYDPEMVLLLRDFYTDLVSTDSLSPTATAVHKVKLGLNAVSLHSLFGNGEAMSFRRLLRRFFPLASERDYEQMFALAYPRAVPRRLRQLNDQEEREYTELFQLYDVDGSGTLTMRELRNALRNSTAFRNTFQDAGQLFAMFKSDNIDQSGVTLAEFLEAMRQAYA